MLPPGGHPSSSHFSQEAGPSTWHYHDSHGYYPPQGGHRQWQQATPPQQFTQQSIVSGDPHSYQLQPPTTHTAIDDVIHRGGEQIISSWW